MFRRVASVVLCSLSLAGVGVVVTGCENPLGEGPGNGQQAASAASCTDSIGSTFSVTPAESTVGPGGTVDFKVLRNGGLYTPGLGSPVVTYSTPDGGVVADPLAIETTYTAPTTPGDYHVHVTIETAGINGAARATECDLVAIVHVVAQQQKIDPPDAGQTGYHGDGQRLDLGGDWAFVMDANQNQPAPVMSLLGASADSVSVSYQGTDGQKCDCNAFHKVIPLGKSYDCSSAVLELDYASGGSFGYTSNEALSIRFCKNGVCGGEGGFYSGDEFKGSMQTGHSNCGWEWNNTLPSAPQLVAGHNTIELAKLQASTNGSCNGSFDTIDVHVEAYACFADGDRGSATLSNLVIR